MSNPCKRKDCVFFSMYTSTCDYTLMNSRKRPCPIDDCTEYTQRTEQRPWMKFWPFIKNTGNGGDKMRRLPEREAEPPEPRSVMADCGHEVYEGESMYIWTDGEMLCPDCFEDKFDSMSADDKAEMCGCDAVPVYFSRGRGYGHAEEEI